ncbi:MAG: biotin--[acetyl-CoA-carboxylase] ligase [Weeksellaceae bacterium]
MTYNSLPSTNQTLYQLASDRAIHFTVVSTFNQTNGKGYTGNQWQTDENQNLTFSFLLSEHLPFQKHLPILNMWIALSIIQVLTKWQIQAYIKWPNDIIIHHKKVGGILIQTKLAQNKIQYIVVGIGLNIYQTNFEGLPQASSIIKEYLIFNKPLDDCLLEMINHLEQSYKNFNPENYDQLINQYHGYLYKKDVVATYEFDGKLHNGILRKVDEDGHAIIEIEGYGLMTFMHKQIKLNY